jgi:type II secretion system protein N
MADAHAKHPLWLKIGFGLSAFVLLLLFTHVLFPYDMIKARVEEGLSQNLGSDVSLGHIKPGFLWGFTVDGLDIKGVKIADKVKISPRLFDLMTGTLGFSFKVYFISSGLGEGYVSLPPQKSKRPLEMSLSLVNVNMSGLSFFFPPSVKPGGIVNGEFSIVTPRESFETATGFLSFNWNKGIMPVKFDEFPFNALTFETLEIDSNIEKGVLTIRKANFNGSMSGNMQGDISLSNEFKNSRLNITGEFNLPPAMRAVLGPGMASPGQGTKFSLRGNFDMPKFRMMSSFGSPMPSTMRAMPIQQNSSQQQQDVMRQQEPGNQQDAARQMDVRRQQDTGLNQTTEPEGEGHE